MDIKAVSESTLMDNMFVNDDERGKALAELYRRYNVALRISLVARSHVGEFDVEDVLQATWSRLLELPKNSFNPEKGKFFSWLYTIAIRVAHNCYAYNKRVQRGGRIQCHHPIHEIPKNVGEPVIDQRTHQKNLGPFDSAVARETSEFVQAAVDSLDNRERSAIEAIYYNEQTFREAARALGVKRGTVVYQCKVAKGVLSRKLSQV